MNEPVSVLAVKAVQLALSDIRTAKGYFTNLGESINRGFYSYFLKAENQIFPFAAIHPATEEVSGSGPKSRKVKFSFVIYLADKGDDTDNLQACFADVRRATALHEGAINKFTLNNSLVFQTAEYKPQPDSNIQLAGIPVSITFMEKYEESP